MFRGITWTVWILSLVSLLNDAASELLIPVMPIYLNSIGFSVVLIGVLEGLAEATAGLSKGYFGQQSDRRGTRVPFIRTGYLFSALSRPMLAIWAAPWWIFLARTLDRLGKGVRTAARDALLGAESTPGTRGAVFGLHRSMDTIGAVIGPAMALWYLSLHPGDYKRMFLIALVPGLLAFACTHLLGERTMAPRPNAPRQGFFRFLGHWHVAPKAYRRLAAGLLVFSLVNSADAFLLLRAKSTGLSDTGVIGMYIFFNAVYAATAFPMGRIADRVGLKRMLLLGLLAFALVYFGMMREAGLGYYVVLFVLYGLYAAATDGISKAWLATLAEPHETATALGLYTGLQSICALIASSMAGVLWYGFGPAAAFGTTGLVTLVVVVYLWLMAPEPNAR